MITLAFDEYGDFEGVTNGNDGVMFIGGILFNDKSGANDSRERKEEARRINAYYNEVCKEASLKLGDTVEYPKGLHSLAKGSHEERKEHDKKVAVVKSIVYETMGEFLQNGTYRKQALEYTSGNQTRVLEERKGEYIVYLMLKSEQGILSRIGKNAGFMNRDDYASNLYFHMASEVLQRTVFQNPLLCKGEHFKLMLATRSSGTLKRDSILANQYNKLKYHPNTKNRNGEDIRTNDNQPGVYYELTNADTYRSIIEQFLVTANDNEATVDEFSVTPIVYNSSQKEQEFLYLADSVCSILSYQVFSEERNSDALWLAEIYSRATKLLPENKLLIFAYDVADVDFSKALAAYKQKDLYQTFSLIYDVREKNTPFDEFYKEHWYSFLKNEIKESDDESSFVAAVRTVRFSQLSNTYEQGRGLFILSELEKLASRMKQRITTPERQDIFYYLYEAEMIAYCHTGDSENAKRYYRLASEYASRVSTEEVLRTRNMLIVCLCDCFEWTEAEKLSLENIEYTKKLAEVKAIVDEQLSSEGYLAEAKAYSQLGQLYGYMRNPEATNMFSNALLLMKEKSANYYITESYLLHHFLDIEDAESYEKYSAEFFGNKTDLAEQYEYIVEESVIKDPIISYKYAFYVYVKGLYLFYKDRITNELWNRILELPFKLKDNPSELIYKYLLLISVYRNDWENYDILMKKLEECYNEGSTHSVLLNAIRKLSVIEVAQAAHDNDTVTKEIKALVPTLEDWYSKQFSNLGRLSEENILAVIRSKFTYMYN